MPVAMPRRMPRFRTRPLDSPARPRRRRTSTQPRLLDALLEDRTLLAFTPISQPTAAYVASTSLIPITVANGSTLTSITDGTETVSFSATMTAATSPTGGFNNWGSPPDVESNSTRVLFNASAQTLTLTFSQPVSTFGIELQQDTFSTDSLSAQFFSGATSVGTVTRTITVPGAPVGSPANGAKLFAASTDLNSQTFTSVVLTGPTTHGFGIAQIRYALPKADLAVTKTGPATVSAGANITYTLNLTNNGPVDAQNAVLTDAVPAGTTFVSATAPAGWSLSTPAPGGTGTVFATNPDVASGATAAFTIVVNVAAGATNGSTIANTAAASSTTTDPNGSNNTATARTTVNSSADLAITKVDTPDPVAAGDYVTYTITMTNNGPSDAQNYAPSDTLPAGTSPNSFTQTSGPAVGGTLPAGATATFVLVAHVDSNLPAGTVLTNTVRAISTTPDPNPNNDTATTTTTVSTSADLAVTKAANPDPVTPGGNLTYTLTLANNGPSDAQAVSLSDGIPAGTTFVSSSAPAGWATSAPPVGGTGTVTFTKASVATFASATFTIVVNVSANFTAAAVSNTATASSSTSDPNTGNNTATTNTPINFPVDLVVTKVASPNPVFPGANLTYTVTVRNAGSAPAANVKLYDLLPDRTTFVSNSGAPGWSSTNPPVGSNGVITSTTPSFAGGATATFVIVVRVPADVRPGTVLTNRAVATTSSSETNTANNSTTASVTVGSPNQAAPKVNSTVTTTGGGQGSAGKAAATQGSAASAQELAIASSAGLVADVLRQKTLSGLFSFGG